MTLRTVITIAMANIADVSESNNIIFYLKKLSKLLTYENFPIF